MLSFEDCSALPPFIECAVEDDPIHQLYLDNFKRPDKSLCKNMRKSLPARFGRLSVRRGLFASNRNNSGKSSREEKQSESNTASNNESFVVPRMSYTIRLPEQLSPVVITEHVITSRDNSGIELRPDEDPTKRRTTLTLPDLPSNLLRRGSSANFRDLTMRAKSLRSSSRTSEAGLPHGSKSSFSKQRDHRANIDNTLKTRDQNLLLQRTNLRFPTSVMTKQEDIEMSRRLLHTLVVREMKDTGIMLTSTKKSKSYAQSFAVKKFRAKVNLVKQIAGVFKRTLDHQLAEKEEKQKIIKEVFNTDSDILDKSEQETDGTETERGEGTAAKTGEVFWNEENIELFTSLLDKFKADKAKCELEHFMPSDSLDQITRQIRKENSVRRGVVRVLHDMRVWKKELASQSESSLSYTTRLANKLRFSGEERPSRDSLRRTKVPLLSHTFQQKPEQCSYLKAATPTYAQLKRGILATVNAKQGRPDPSYCQLRQKIIMERLPDFEQFVKKSDVYESIKNKHDAARLDIAKRRMLQDKGARKLLKKVVSQVPPGVQGLEPESDSESDEMDELDQTMGPTRRDRFSLQSRISSRKPSNFSVISNKDNNMVNIASRGRNSLLRTSYAAAPSSRWSRKVAW